MANLKSAKKRIRRNERARVVNKSRRSRIRRFIRKVEEAILAGNANDAQVAYASLQPEIDRGVAKGIMKKNTVARKKSQLVQRIKALGGGKSKKK